MPWYALQSRLIGQCVGAGAGDLAECGGTGEGLTETWASALGCHSLDLSQQAGWVLALSPLDRGRFSEIRA